MDRASVHLAVGVVMIAGMAAAAYVSINLGSVSWLGGGGYTVSADFPSTGGLKTGSSVDIAGVDVGRVQSVTLVDDQAHVVMRIASTVKLQDDAIAAIKTKGLIGEKYVSISPGGSDHLIPPNGKIREVQPPVDLEDLLSKYIFGKV